MAPGTVMMGVTRWGQTAPGGVQTRSGGVEDRGPSVFLTTCGVMVTQIVRTGVTRPSVPL